MKKTLKNIYSAGTQFKSGTRSGLKIFIATILMLSLIFITGYPAAYENRANFTGKSLTDIAGGAHREINSLAMEMFIKSAQNDPILMYYDFDPSSSGYPKVKKLNENVPSEYLQTVFTPVGKAVYKRASYASDKDSIWQKLPYTFLKWIEEGGFSADEPEYYM
ncbi:MAG: hypothetical protein PHG48_03290, partial [Eubacteriales bacterium]|nr:hypothetical protein [Eubacteriales bacterium]